MGILINNVKHGELNTNIVSAFVKIKAFLKNSYNGIKMFLLQ